MCCMIGCVFDIVFGFCVDCGCFCICVTYLCRVVVRYSGPEHQCLAPFDAGQHPILYLQLQVVQGNLRSSASSLHVPPSHWFLDSKIMQELLLWFWSGGHDIYSVMSSEKLKNSILSAQNPMIEMSLFEHYLIKTHTLC